MVIHLIESFAEINRAQINCISPLNKAVNNLSDSVYCVITTQTFFESKLFIIGKEVVTVFLNKTVLKQFRYNWANGYTPKIFARRGLGD